MSDDDDDDNGRMRLHQSFEDGEAASDRILLDEPGRLAKVVQCLSRVFVFFGPAQLVAVGYIDPGNWATDLAGGAQSGYIQLVTILLCNLSAIVLQLLSVKLGAVTGKDLAQTCKQRLGKYTNIVLWLSCELAIVATDLAEVIGSALALYLLFDVPLVWGILLTGLDVFIILLGLQDKLFYIEVVISVMVALVFGGLVAIVFRSAPSPLDVLLGCLPIHPEIVVDQDNLLTMIAIIGATIMPHNLYLHSSLAVEHFSDTTRLSSSAAAAAADIRLVPLAPAGRDAAAVELDHAKDADVESSPTTDDEVVFAAGPEFTIDSGSDADAASHVSVSNSTLEVSQLLTETAPIADDSSDDMRISVPPSAVKAFLYHSKIGLIVSLSLACVINGAILVVAGTQFLGMEPVPGILEAYSLLYEMLGVTWATVFAVSLLLSGQSATITATMAGSIVMEGFLELKLPPWIRRLLTRSLAIIPALLVAMFMGSDGLDSLLVLSQVVLSLQLPFSIFPLVYFTSDPDVLGGFANSRYLAWLCYGIVVVLTVGNAVSVFGLFSS